MSDVYRLGPQHGLRQGRDSNLLIDLDASWNLTADLTARMSVREKLEDAQPVDRLTTENGRIQLVAAHDDGSVTLKVRFPRAVTSAWRVPYMQIVQRDLEGRAVRDAKGNDLTHTVQRVFATLYVTGADGEDRPSQVDFRLDFKAGWTRE